MIHAAARAQHAVRAVAEGDQAEAIALSFGGQRQVQRGGDIAFQNLLARRKPGSVHDHVDFLRVLHLVELHHGRAPVRGGFPVDIFVAIARYVFAQSLEFAALAHLALDAHAGIGRAQKQRRRSAIAQVRVDAQVAGEGQAGARQPQSQRRGSLDVQIAQGMIAARGARAGPCQRGAAGLQRDAFGEALGRDPFRHYQSGIRAAARGTSGYRA